MSPIISHSGAPAHVHPDEAARQRRDRLARATADQAEAALTYLSMIDPLMFEIAMDAADLITGTAPRDEPAGDEDGVPVCRRCGGQAGIFLDRGLDWLHFTGDGTTAGAQEVYDPGHPAEVTWRLPGGGWCVGERPDYCVGGGLQCGQSGRALWWARIHR